MNVGLKYLFWACLLLLIVTCAIAFYRVLQGGFFKTRKFLFFLIATGWTAFVLYLYFRHSLPAYLNEFLAGSVGSLVVLWHLMFRPFNKENAAYYQGYGLGLFGRTFVKKKDVPPENMVPDKHSWGVLDTFAFKHHALFFWGGTFVFSAVVVGYIYAYLVLQVDVLWGILVFFTLVPMVLKFNKILFHIEGQSPNAKDAQAVEVKPPLE